MKQTLFILIFHGSKMSKEDEINNLIQKINKDNAIIDCAYLEIQEPSLRECIAKHAQQINEVIVFPIFILAGKHITIDLPKKIEKCQKEFPDIVINMKQHLGVLNSFQSYLNNLINEC